MDKTYSNAINVIADWAKEYIRNPKMSSSEEIQYILFPLTFNFEGLITQIGIREKELLSLYILLLCFYIASLL